jgi:uroporphyrinogen decarboxylase
MISGPHSVNKPLLEILDGGMRNPPPVWLMRQAGRYLPEYRAVRAKAGDFLKLCLTPELAAEITLQPIRRFGFDAAILFSDILVVPHALGQQVWFSEGEGPRLEPIVDRAGVARLRTQLDQDPLMPVYEAIGKVKASLAPAVALLGFCGGPWTVASYMIAGQGTPDQAPARLFAYRDPQGFALLIDILVERSANYLIRQFQAGVDAVQIFDTWAGVLPAEELRRWCIEPMQRLIGKLRSEIPTAKIIAFPRGIGAGICRFISNVAVDAVGLDWTMDLDFAREHVPLRVALQGNLDPLVLLVGGNALDRSIDGILDVLSGRPFIFNLGHGVLPQTPIAHVEQMLARIRGR